MKELLRPLEMMNLCIVKAGELNEDSAYSNEALIKNCNEH
jgi:hypothetical protein